MWDKTALMSNGKPLLNISAFSLSLLWAARQGLNEAELLKILDIPQAVWSPLYLALQNALVSRDGLLSFFHYYLKQAVENRYLLSREKQPSSYFSKIIYWDRSIPTRRVL